MRLTLHTDYALRVLMYLGLREDGLASIREIAEAYGISENHLTKVVHGLGRAGFIDTLRGRGGGLRLAMPPDAIRIGAVVRRTEDDMALVACFSEGGHCTIAGPCLLRPLLREALEAFLAVLDRVTLAELIGPRRVAIAEALGLGAAPP